MRRIAVADLGEGIEGGEIGAGEERGEEAGGLRSRRPAGSSPEDISEHFANRGHVIGVDAAELTQHQAGPRWW